MKLSIFDLPRGSRDYVELPSKRCINVHVSRVSNDTMVHVQANSEQWPQEYSDTLVHCKDGVSVLHSVTKNLTADDIDYLQTHFTS